MQWLRWLALLAGALAAPPSVDECYEGLESLKEELAKCEASLKQTEATVDSSSASGREEYQALKEKLRALEKQVKEREAVLRHIEAENDELHDQFIERVQRLALVQRQHPVDEWAECKEQASVVRLDLQRCVAKRAIIRARRWDSKRNWEMLHESRQRRIEILRWRLESLDKMIGLAESKRERLRNQLDVLEKLTLVHTGRHRRPDVHREWAVAPQAVGAVAMLRAARTGKSHGLPPRAELEEKLAAAEREAGELQDTFEQAKSVVAEAKQQVDDAHARITSLAKDVKATKKKTLDAFKVAFTLDTKLDKLEDEHEVALLESKKATDRWESTFEKSNVAEFNLEKKKIKIARLRHQLQAVDAG